MLYVIVATPYFISLVVFNNSPILEGELLKLCFPLIKIVVSLTVLPIELFEAVSIASFSS